MARGENGGGEASRAIHLPSIASIASITSITSVVGLWLLAACPGDDGSTQDGSSTTSGPASTGPSSADASTTTPTTTPTTTTDPDTTQGPSDSGTDTGTTGTTGEIPPNCGDGIPDPDEACDDGNMIDADGCNNDCTVSGSVLWFHTQAGGVGQNEEGFGVVVDDQGRAYVAGEFFAVDLDFWVRQYEGDGIGWTQSFDGGATTDGARGIARAGSTLYAIGYTAVPGQSNDVWLRALGLYGSPGLVVSYN
ncbi:MAG: hypothetical protein KDK70_24535, partial [Myxococcales bacterium]|nr:hypothetical protein [Myxococcales bacterium]